jgi:hypothetical protein
MNDREVSGGSITYLIFRSVPSNVISCSTRRRTSLTSLCNSMAPILLFNDTLSNTHEHNPGSGSRELTPQILPRHLSVRALRHPSSLR